MNVWYCNEPTPKQNLKIFKAIIPVVFLVHLTAEFPVLVRAGSSSKAKKIPVSQRDAASLNTNMNRPLYIEMGAIFHVLFFTFIVKLLVQSLKLLLTTCKLESNFQQLPSLTKNLENCDVQLSG